MKTRSCRAIYVMQEHNRWFCFTFGASRHLIEDAAIERNFGLRVSLNLGDPDAIKAIEKTNISHLALQSHEQAGRDVQFDGFEFNTDIDLLKSITSKSREKDGEEQETYSGRDSISVYTRADLGSLSELAERLYKASQSKRYQKLYPWIDKISEERDAAVIAQLNDKLVEAINTGHTDKIWLALPEFISWEEVQDFAYRLRKADDRKAGPVTRPDIDLETWLTDTGLSGSVSLSILNSRKIYKIYKDGREPSGWPVYRCLNAEIDLGRRKFILNDGDWYCVEEDYVTQVNGFYQAIPESDLRLPAHCDATEPKYLETLTSQDARFALMDRKTIPIGGGKSKVEFCDLYTQAGDIIHVKQYGGSSLLSHLFSQALVSAECFFHEQEFRRKAYALLPAGFGVADPARDPRPQDFTICIAIMSKVAGPLELPFFSKVSLRHAVTALRRMNLKVTRLKIER